MLETKTHLSGLIADLESHKEHEVIIARHGRPVARLEAVSTFGAESVERRVGIARGVFTVPDDIDAGFGDMGGFLAGESAPERSSSSSSS